MGRSAAFPALLEGPDPAAVARGAVGVGNTALVVGSRCDTFPVLAVLSAGAVLVSAALPALLERPDPAAFSGVALAVLPTATTVAPTSSQADEDGERY